MSKAIINEQHLHDIADAIIDKGGATAPMTPAQMPAAIAAIPSGGGTETFHWKIPNDWPNLEDIVNNAGHSEYPYKIGFLFVVSDDFTITDTRNWNKSGTVKFEYSDNPGVLENGSNHIWDASKDIPITSFGEKARYLIAHCTDKYVAGYEPKNKGNILWVYGKPGSEYYVYYTQFTADRMMVFNCDQYRFTSGIISGSSIVEIGGKVRADSSTSANSTENLNALRYCHLTPHDGEVATAMGRSNCNSLIYAAEFPVVTTLGSIYSHISSCGALRKLPDSLNLLSLTSIGSGFTSLYSLESLPTHLSINISFSFANSHLVSNDSIATFDSDGNIVGGLVYNLNTCPNSGQTATFSSVVRSRFSDEKWEAIKAALAAKNWGCSPA